MVAGGFGVDKRFADESDTGLGETMIGLATVRMISDGIFFANN